MAGFDAELAVKIGGDTSELVAATRKGSEEMRAFARESLEAAKIVESIRTPQQAYAQKQERLNELLHKGQLSTDEHKRATEKLSQEFERATGVTQRRNEAFKRGEQITREVETAEERYARDLAEVNDLQRQGALTADAANKKRQKLADDMEANSKSAGMFGRSVDGIAESLQRRFSPAALAGSAAMGVFTVAVNEFRKEYEKYQELTGAGEQGLENIADGRKQLFQIFSKDEAELRALQADRAAVSTSLSREESLQLMFDAGSQVFVEDFGQVARAAQLLGGNSGKVAGAMGRKFNATPMQALGGFLAASGGSIANFDDLSKDAFGASMGGEAIGASLDETLGMLAALTNEVGDSSKAANLMRTFGLKMQGAGLGGGGFEKARGRLESLSAEQQLKVVGDNQELRQVLNAMRKGSFQEEMRGAQASARSEIESGGAILRERIEAIEKDTALAAVTAKQNAEERLQIAGEKEALAKMGRENRARVLQADLAASGESQVVEGIQAPLTVGRALQGLATGQGMDANAAAEQSFRDMMNLGVRPTTTVEAELERQAKRQTALLEKIAGQSDQPGIVESLP